jgi:serine/threonine-protein kinase
MEATAPDELKRWFERYLAIAEDLRTQWLKAQTLEPSFRAELEALIAAAGRNDLLSKPVGEWFLRLDDELEPITSDQLLGQTVGDYRLVKQLGAGGMGAVYLGERVEGDFRHQVAIKLLQHGWHSAQQDVLFRRERQILASLSHPNIARLLDAGVTANNIAFLVMEYVQGSNIAQYCREGALNTLERVALVRQVCVAVAAAHTQLVVHRDIKPANVLVTDQGEVKLLDFGIAKLLDNDTQTYTAKPMMTYAYASPEQREGNAIGTPTDVYALGVLLHELLLGVRPSGDHSARPSQLALAKTEAQFRSGQLPARPNQLAQLLRGDLDTILQRALEPDPARRYQAAQALADDLERFLKGMPVLAHPPSRWYRARKFIRRHQGSVIVSTLLALGLLISIVMALIQTSRALNSAREASAQAERASVVRDFLLELMQSTAEDLPRDQRPTPAALAARAEAKLTENRTLAPDVMLDLRLTFADINLIQRDFEGTARNLDQARPLLSEQLDEARLRWLNLEASRLMFEGKAEQSVAVLRPLRQELKHSKLVLAPTALQTLAYAEWDLGALDEALALHKAAALRFERMLGADHPSTLKAGMVVGNHFASVQRWQEAEAELAPRIARWRALAQAPDAQFANALVNRGYALLGLGRTEFAREVLEESLALRRAIFTAPRDRIANSLSALGQLELDTGRYSESIRYREESLSMRLAQFDVQHPLVIVTRIQLAGSQIAMGAFDEAEQTLAPAHKACGVQAPVHPYCALLPQVEARLRNEQGDFLAAEAAALKSVQMAKTLHGENSPELARPRIGLAQAFAGLKQGEKSLHAIDAAIELADPSTAAGHKARIVKAQVLAQFGQFESARQLSDELLAANARPILDPHDQAKLRIVQIEALKQLQRLDELAAEQALLKQIDGPYLSASWRARQQQALGSSKSGDEN